MVTIVFITTLVVEILTVISVGLSLAFPARGIWPPLHHTSWQAYWMWLLFIASSLGMIALGILDWRAAAFALWVRFGIGAPLWLAGGALALWAGVVLGLTSSFGKEDALIEHAPYSFSRNPQYVGFIVSLVGWALLSSSVRTLIAALIGIVPLILVPFAEEPWLAQAYGVDYKAYCRTVPRFLFFRPRGRKTMI